MRRMISASALVGGLLATAPVAAQDMNGFRAISSGDLKLAEQELTSQRQSFPSRPELMLNLAHVYVKTARQEQARLLYREVLAQRDVAMDLPDGSIVSSHALASLGLTRLSGTALAVR